jgi:P pilus assembly chaperone PapD
MTRTIELRLPTRLRTWITPSKARKPPQNTCSNAFKLLLKKQELKITNTKNLHCELKTNYLNKQVVELT